MNIWNDYFPHLESRIDGKYGPKLGFISTSIPMACGITKISENKIAASEQFFLLVEL
jgi:hypothetical protein